MTIQSITPIILDLPFDVGTTQSSFAGRPRQMAMLLIRVETESGLVGWGEAFGYAVWPATQMAIKKIIAPMVVGQDETNIKSLMDELQRQLHLLGRTGPVVYALSGLDIALWDIAGKKANQPLATLLGGAKHTDFSVYASLVRYNDGPLIARQAKAALDQGFSAIKLHEIDVAHVATARNAIGDHVPLMMDTNCPWSTEEAISKAQSLQKYNLHWLEEPIYPPEDFLALARVRKEGRVKIAAGENAMSPTDFRALFDANAVDFAQPSVTKVGGVSEMKRIIDLAGDRKVKLIPHSPYFGPGLLATMHLCATIEPDTLIEYSYVKLGANPVGEAVRLKNGRLQLPLGAGLGFDPDPDIVSRYQLKS
jgi:L-alanine-DL-glutamate epimerase-like enolase superfamily enzyme